MHPSAPRAPVSPWHALDKIYCITLADRPDRRAAAEAQFAQVGLGSLVEFVIVQRHPTDSEQGIFESHQRCLRQGLAAGSATIAVFEDDVIFPAFSPQVLQDAITFLQSATPWDIFFFGCFVNASRKTPHRSVLKIRFKTTTHAYVVSRAFAAQLLAIPWRGTPFDDMVRSLASARAFAAYPALAFQSAASTDNRKLLAVDRVRRILGGMRRLQRLNEWTHRHFVTLIAVHTFILLAAIALLVLRWKMQ